MPSSDKISGWLKDVWDLPISALIGPLLAPPIKRSTGREVPGKPHLHPTKGWRGVATHHRKANRRRQRYA